MPEMLILREFSKADWYGFAGAEPAADGRMPLMSDVMVDEWPDWDTEDGARIMAVILDASGLSIIGVNCMVVLECTYDLALLVVEAFRIHVAEKGALDFKDLLKLGFRVITVG